MATSSECISIDQLPHTTRLFADFLRRSALQDAPPLRSWYAADPHTNQWIQPSQPSVNRDRLADALLRQSREFSASPSTLANIEKLRSGALAVVTGQQVGLFGGPLLTLLKAATAVAKAAEATARSGITHVPVFWLATEDHDIEEVNQLTLLAKRSLETISLALPESTCPVGAIKLGEKVEAALEHCGSLLGYSTIWHTLKEFYQPDETLASAFAKWMAHLFADHGLIVMDASGRDFHAIGSPVLRQAIEHVEAIEQAVLERSRQIEANGYHAQVLVKPGNSLLFLVDEGSGRRELLRHLPDGTWKTTSKGYATTELLQILEEQPERLSPNALLRPVFQDLLLPTAAYIGGPAEIAYFAQSSVLYERILGTLTPVLPRLSATLIEPSIATIMAAHEVSLAQVIEAKTADQLASRFAARAIPIEAKRLLASAGNSLDSELRLLTDYTAAMDADLGRSTQIAANKMRYQMNRLRRLSANFELQKTASLRKHADTLVRHLYPEAHLQERVIGGIWFLATGGETLIDRLVEAARSTCSGHSVLEL